MICVNGRCQACYSISVIISEWDVVVVRTRKSSHKESKRAAYLVMQARVFLSVSRYVWFIPLSYSSSCMLVNHGPSQQSSKEEYKPWKWGANARYYTSHTKTMLQKRKVHSKIQHTVGPHEDLLIIIKRRRLQWYGHVSHSLGLDKTILQGTMKGGRRQTEEEVGRQHQGMDRPGVRQVPEGSGEQRKMEKTGFEIICGALTTLAVKG